MNKFLTGSFIILLVVIASLFVYYAYHLNIRQTGNGLIPPVVTPIQEAQQTQPPPATPTPTAKAIPFDYEVKSVSTTEIVLKGKKGDLILPKDASKVTIYQGASPGIKTDFSAIKVGQKIKLDVDPGKQAWVYILQ